jgi:hypothetical protein
MIGKSKNRVVNQNITPLEFTKRIRSCLRSFNIPVNVTTRFDDSTERRWVYVGGLYDGTKDQKNRKFITIDLWYNPADTLIKLPYTRFRRICGIMADVILHEIIHMRQYRRRNYKDMPGYQSVAESRKQRLEQEYLGHNDEIDAYSFNIACDLYEKFKYDHKKVINYLNRDAQDRRLRRTWYRTYLEAFDYNHNHKVIKKLKKKIIHYLPYAELGKPYKTSDWLKK